MTNTLSYAGQSEKSGAEAEAQSKAFWGSTLFDDEEDNEGVIDVEP